MSRTTLSESDVKRLLNDPSPDVRADTASKLALNFGELDLTMAERKLAVEIFRIMAKDAEVRVREALSKNLKQNPAVPHDVAVSLARDVDAVSLPMLQFSSVLTDQDLIEIVESQGVHKQVAIAKRANLSEKVSDALVETNNATVVATLVANDGAALSEKTLNKVVDRFGDNERIQAPLVHRASLPMAIAERLVTKVSESLRDHLISHHDLPPDLATDLILQSRERATLGLLRSGGGEGDIDSLVNALKENGRLTPSIILRALCTGDLGFAESGLAARAGIPTANARALMYDSGSLGFEAIYQKADMPAPYFAAARAAIDVARENVLDGGDHDRERYSRRAIERILTQYGDLGVDFASDDLDYLLGKMAKLPASVAPV